MAINLPTFVTAETTKANDVRISSTNLNLEANYSFNGILLKSSGLDADRILRPVFATAKSILDASSQGLKLTIESHVPIGMGLGSSAATAVATLTSISALMSKNLGKEEVFQAAYALEKMIHGRPSGVDQATVTYGNLITYRNGKVSSFPSLPKSPLLVIGNTGKRRSTGEYVSKVTSLRADHPDEYSRIAQQAQQIADKATIAIQEGSDRTLGALMDENQNLLESIGVSSPDLDRLIAASRSAGALGAKLTGGGGGGCMIALVNDESEHQVTEAIQQSGGEIIQAAFMSKGVTAKSED